MSADSTKLTDEERKAMGVKLKEAREYIGFSQVEVAKALGIPRTALSLMESGQRRVDALELKKMASLYERPVTHFTTDDSEPIVGSAMSHLERKVSELSDDDRGELERFVNYLHQRSRESED